MTAFLGVALHVTYTLVTWVDAQIDPWLLNDHPLPMGTGTLPQQAGITYPIGSMATIVFGSLEADDVTFITAACKHPVTLTLPAGGQSPAWVRATGTATFDGVLLRVTLTQPCNIGYLTKGIGYY